MLDYKAIGRRIKYYRKKCGLTQAEVAEQLHVENGYVSQIERGVALISLKRLSEMADILKVDIALLISDTGYASSTYGYSELMEIIKDWNTEDKDLLVEMVKTFDEHRYAHKKK